MNTCNDCVSAQAYLTSIKYIRIHDTDIMIVACQKHLKKIQGSSLEMKYETLEEIRTYSKSESD